MTYCAAKVNKGIGGMSMKDWKEGYQGKIVSRLSGHGFTKQCGNNAGHTIERDGMVFQVCGTHTNEKACLIAEYGRPKVRPLAEVENDREVVLIDTTTGEEVVTMPKLFTDLPKPLFTVAWTGHRPQKLGGFDKNPIRTKVKHAMLAKAKEIIEQYDDHEVVFITGGALGVDQWAAALARHLGLRYVVAAPFASQAKMWPVAAQQEYSNLCNGSDELLSVFILDHASMDKYPEAHYDLNTKRIIVSDGPYTGWKMQKRNEFMVDAADAMVAVWDATTGGTANCVRYAEATNKPIYRINPRKL